MSRFWAESTSMQWSLGPPGMPSFQPKTGLTLGHWYRTKGTPQFDRRDHLPGWGDDLDKILAKVSRAGGKVILAKTFYSSEAGYIGVFLDTEANWLALQHPAA